MPSLPPSPSSPSAPDPGRSAGPPSSDCCRAARPAHWPRALGLAALLVAFLAAGTAQAARPMVTEDAPVQADGECAIESFAGRGASGLAPRSRLVSAQLGCGVSAATQLAAALSHAEADDATVDALLLAGKTRLWQARGDAPAADAAAGAAELSLAYGLVLNRPRQARAQWAEAYALLATSLPLAADWKLHANLGWSGSREARASTTTWAAALEWAPREGLALSVEAFGNDRDGRPWLQLGASQAIGGQLSLNASVGRQGRDARVLTVGLTAGF